MQIINRRQKEMNILTTEFKDRVLLPEQIQYLLTITSEEDVADLESRIETLAMMSCSKQPRQFCYFTGYDEQGQPRKGILIQNEYLYRNFITYILTCSPKNKDLVNYVMKFKKQIRYFLEAKGEVFEEDNGAVRSLFGSLQSSFENVQTKHDDAVVKKINNTIE